MLGMGVKLEGWVYFDPWLRPGLALVGTSDTENRCLDQSCG